jgi:hypothetical protein
MNKKKKQHYVPRFILRNFASSAEKLAVYRKSSRSVFGGNVNDYGHENYFYELPDPDGTFSAEERQAVEDWLEGIDTRASSVINRLIRYMEWPCWVSADGVPDYRLSEGEKLELSIFIVVQSLRTPEHRESNRQMHYLMSKASARMMAAIDPRLPKDIRERLSNSIDVEMHPDFVKALQLRDLLNEQLVTGLVNLCMHKRWFIGINTSDELLYLPDHPVLRIYHREDAPGYGGWTAPGLEIALPLSPRLILSLQSTDLWDHFDRKRLGDRELIPDRAMLLNREHILFYNSHSYFRSFDFIFAARDDFWQAKEMTVEQPHFADPYRVRASVSSGVGKIGLPEDWAERRRRLPQ